MAGKKRVGILEIALRLDAATFTKRLANASKGFGSFMKKWGSTLAIAGAAAAGVTTTINALGKAFAFAVEQMEKIEKVGRISDRLGLAIEDLSALQRLGEGVGIDVSGMDTNLQRLRRKIGGALRGVQEDIKIFESLGIDPQALASLDAVSQLQAVASRIRALNDSMQQLNVTVKIFDTEGANMLQLFKDTNWQVSGQIELMKQYGQVLTAEGYEKAKAFNGELTKLSHAWEQFKLDIATAIVPLVDFADTIRFLGVYLQTLTRALAHFANMLNVKLRPALAAIKAFLPDFTPLEERSMAIDAYMAERRTRAALTPAARAALPSLPPPPGADTNLDRERNSLLRQIGQAFRLRSATNQPTVSVRF